MLIIVYCFTSYYYFRLEIYNKTIIGGGFLICKMINVEVRVISHAFGSADNSYLDIDNSAYHKPHPIIVYYNFC